MPVVPNDNVKKDCPSANKTPSIETSSRRGCKMYFSPSNDPSSVKDLITITIKKINNSGIINLEAFSKPFSTPIITINIVNNIKMPCPVIVKKGLLIIDSNCILPN